MGAGTITWDFGDGATASEQDKFTDDVTVPACYSESLAGMMLKDRAT